VMKLRKSICVDQCHRCQIFGHTASFCTSDPRCVKCGKGHLTPLCTKARDIPAACANCGEAHTANYQGCNTIRGVQSGYPQSPLPRCSFRYSGGAPRVRTKTHQNSPTIPSVSKAPGYASTAKTDQQQQRPQPTLRQLLVI
jgi:hypothetical protein